MRSDPHFSRVRRRELREDRLNGSKEVVDSVFKRNDTAATPGELAETRGIECGDVAARLSASKPHPPPQREFLGSGHLRRIDIYVKDRRLFNYAVITAEERRVDTLQACRLGPSSRAAPQHRKGDRLAKLAVHEGFEPGPVMLIKNEASAPFVVRDHLCKASYAFG